MRSWMMRGWVLAIALILVAPATAAAQGTLGAGLSFLNDDGTAVGVTVDYSRPIRSLANNRSLGWVGDVSYHRDSEDDLGIDVNYSALTVQGGVRVSGPLGQNEKLSWHAQGLAGIFRASADIDGLIGDVCDLVDADCDESETRFIVTPGAGVDYALNGRAALRAQIDFMLGDDISAARFWFGVSFKTRE